MSILTKDNQLERILPESSFFFLHLLFRTGGQEECLWTYGVLRVLETGFVCCFCDAFFLPGLNCTSKGGGREGKSGEGRQEKRKEGRKGQERKGKP
jgi:hypothetical protein